jgi:hypothetical protein
MGFDERWIDRIMVCISSVSYKFKVNGECTEVVYPERGLRQGDPLSPYLFLMCAEGFSSLLNKADTVGSLKGIHIANSAPSLNHLLSADDSLVLMKANNESATVLQQVLELYENSSGQTINFDKSSVLFSKNTSNASKQEVLSVLHIRAEAKTEKYLGLPVYVGMSKKKVFEYLKDRIWKRIQGWVEKLLSRAGKDVLIKACAQAIPTFAMSCFDITKSLCEEMGAMICRFWWAQQDNMNKVHWLSWEVLTRPKHGGDRASEICMVLTLPC